VLNIEEPDIPLDVFTQEHDAYMIGYPDGLIKPKQYVTRAEVVTVFFRLMTDETRAKYKTDEIAYTDFTSANWYFRAVTTLTNMGIVNGYKDATFRANQPITRAELAKISTRFIWEYSTKIVTFSDIEGHWAKDYILEAASRGWLEGYPDGTFLPNNILTRAEFATLINRILTRFPESFDDLLPGMITWPDNANTGTWYYLTIQEATNSHERKEKSTQVPETPFYYEKWVKLLPSRDWSLTQS